MTSTRETAYCLAISTLPIFAAAWVAWNLYRGFTAP